MAKIKKDKLKERVYNFKTKHEHGFAQADIDKLLKHYPDIDMEKFNGAFGVLTVMVIDGETVYYHTDVLTALRCGVEKRDMNFYEWD